MEYFDINANNVNSITSIYVSDENKVKLEKVLASSFTKNLLELDLSGCKKIKGKLPVAKCKGLKKINIKDTKISNIDSLDKCTELEEAKLIISKKTELNFNYNKLKLLELQISNEGSIDKVNNLPNLETLKIYGKYYVYSFRDISEIFKYTNIKNLYLKKIHLYCEYLNQLQELTFLRLDGCYLIFDKNTPKINVPLLKQLEIHNITKDYIQKGIFNKYIKDSRHVCNHNNEITFFQLFINSNINKLHISYDNNIYKNDINKFFATINNIDGIENLIELEELYLITNMVTDINVLLKNNKLKTVYYNNDQLELPENKHFEVCYI
jgi:hypothetical protein